jgi:two-component system CAI-1 autoinducer sensor kinase/phosphatase CqsS
MVYITTLSIFINFFACLLLALLFASFGKKYHKFALFNLNVSVWSFFYGYYVVAESYHEALLYSKLTSVCLVLIPYLFFNAAVEITNTKIKRSYHVINGLVVLIMSLSMITPYMVKGVKPYLDFQFIPDITIFYYLYPLYYTVLVVFGLGMMHKAIKKDYKMKTMSFGFTIGFIGGTTNLLPYMNIPVYPLGNFLVGMYSAIISYHLVRRRIFDVLMAVNQIAIKVTVSLMLVCAYFFIVKVYRHFLGGSVSSDALFHLLYFIVSLEFYRVFGERLSKLREGVYIGAIYKKREIFKGINDNILNSSNIEGLSLNLENIIERDMGVKIHSFYISTDLNIISSNKEREFVRYSGDELSDEDLKDLVRISKREIFRLSIKCDEVDEEFYSVMKRIDCQGFIPLIFNDKKMGFILLKGRNKKKNYFFYDDMELFDDLVLKVGIALDRIRSYLISLRERESSLKSLAGSIAHEMRNPLGAIRLAVSNSNLFFESVMKAFEKEQSITFTRNDLESVVENYNISLNSIKRANEIIDITLNEIKGEKPDPAKFSYYNVYDSIAHAVNEFGYKDKNEKSKVLNQLIGHRDDCFIFKGDETLFVYIIFNLLKNALYYLKLHPNSIVTIGLYPDDNYNSIYFQDTGPGIKPDVINKLFTDFVTSGKEGGTGLGLSFCKRTMQIFGGDIRCESELGKYTKFIISFPKIPQEEMALARQIIDDRRMGLNVDSVGKKILMVDDQKVNLMVSKKAVEGSFKNIVFDTAENGAEALKLLEKGKNYNLILMDIQMPGMDGYQLSREIRKSNKKVPIVAYTSRRSIEARKDAALSGMSGYLPKPIVNDFFLRNLAKWALIPNYGRIPEEQLMDILQNKNILLVDDEATNRKITQKLLKRYKIIVTEATNGQEALEILQQNHAKIDLILSDINMPVMNGVNFVKNVRKYEFEDESSIKRIPAVAITGDFNEDLIYNILTSGFDDYLIKGRGDHQDIFNVLALLIRMRGEESYELSNLNSEELAMVEKRSTERDKLQNSLSVVSPKYSDLKLIDEDKLSFFNKEEQKELIESFLESSKKIIEQIKLSKNSNDPARLFFESHALKGISGNIGSERLFKYAVYINEFGRKKSFPSDEKWLEDLTAIFEETYKVYSDKL